MRIFYVLIKKGYLSIYEKNDSSYEKVYLGGNPEYAYSMNSVKDYINRLLEMIAEEYNLNTIGEIDFIVIDNEDEIISDIMLKALGKYVKKRIRIENLILKISDRLVRDEKLHIPEYGINYDGRKFLVRNQRIVKGEFSLLAYPLDDDMLMKFIEPAV